MRRTARFAMGLLISSLLAAGSQGQQISEPKLSQWPAPPFWSPSPGLAAPAEARELSTERTTAAAASPAYAFVPIAPCRQYNSLNFTPLLQGVNRTVPLTGVPCGIQAGAVAVSANITVFNITGALGNGVFKVDTVSPPLNAWINYPPTEAQRANAGVVAVNGSGQIIVQVAQGGGQVDFVVDVNGYYTSDLGNQNTFVGLNAGNLTMTGSSNTAIGAGALQVNTTGFGNTASGVGALVSNTTGVNNAAIGAYALQLNTTGSDNVASGVQALQLNTTGTGNTATGTNALDHNTSANFNTATGDLALSSNTTGEDNTAIGFQALQSNTTGYGNMATGTNALQNSDVGCCNTASGFQSLQSNTTGNQNTAIGNFALQGNTTGSNNIAIGNSAGIFLTTGDNNIAIGNAGLIAESNTIRIGTLGIQAATFIFGISGATSAGGVAVFVNGSGQLGTLTSSARFKDDIHDLGEGSEGLLKLRPVSFRYKPELDPTGLEQYGLVAEEVAEVYPDLVTCDDEGQPQAVRYHFLVPMLINEVQKDRKTIEEQRLGMEAQRLRVQKLEARLERLEALLSVSAR